MGSILDITPSPSSPQPRRAPPDPAAAAREQERLEAAAKAYRASGGHVLSISDVGSLGRIAERLGHRKLPAFFARGSLALAQAVPAIAVVGARSCTDAAKKRAAAIAAELARRKVVVVSGGARGVDHVAHVAALAAGGRSIAVLGEPARHDGGDERREWMRRAFDQAPERTLSMTPHAPWTQHAPALYAGRNEYIAALADAVVIVEAGLASGTRYTADAATRMGIPIWVCLGDTDASAFCWDLVNAGRARALAPWRGVDDLVADPTAATSTSGSASPCAASPTKRVDPAADLEPGLARDIVVAVVAAGGRLLVDEACRRLDMPPGRILAEAAFLTDRIRIEGAFLVVRAT